MCVCLQAGIYIDDSSIPASVYYVDDVDHWCATVCVQVEGA